MGEKTSTLKEVSSRFVGNLTKKGKRNLFSNIFLNTVAKVGKNVSSKSSVVLHNVMRTLGTIVEVKTLRVRKQVTIVPCPVRSHRRDYLVVRHIKRGILKNERKESLQKKLENEITATLMKKVEDSKSLEERSSIHKEAVQNRSHMHFRW